MFLSPHITPKRASLTLAFVLMLMLPDLLLGDPITVGGTGGGNTIPFGSAIPYPVNQNTNYEVEYTLPNVGAINIQTLSFYAAFANVNADDPYTYLNDFRLTLAYGANLPGAMSTNMAQNIGMGHK
jgi:hypothetical protein